MPSPNTPPPLHQIPFDPRDYFAAQPRDIDAGIVAAGIFAFSVGRAGDINDVNERVGVAQVVEEFVAQPFALVRTGDEPRNVKELDGHAALAGCAGAVVGFAAVGDGVARAGTVDLEVAYCALRVDCCEAVWVREGGARVSRVRSREGIGMETEMERTGNFLRACYQLGARAVRLGMLEEGLDRPTLEEASVREFSVELLPALGLPTRPINGSRGISREKEYSW